MTQWRPTTWVVIVVNVAFAVWLIVALGLTDPCDMRGEAVAECAGRTLSGGGGVGEMTIVGFWTLTDILLAFVWLATKSRSDPRGSNIYRRPESNTNPHARDAGGRARARD